jgi:hypothetical protein
MRWTDLFDYLEGDFQMADAVDDAAGTGLHRSATTVMSILSGARSVRMPIAVGLRDGTTLSLTVRAVGRGWFSAVAQGEFGSAFVIPQHAIDWVQVDSRVLPADPTSGVDLGEVLVDLARRQVAVRAKLRGGVARGSIQAVGDNWFDLAQHRVEHPAQLTRITVDALHCIVVDSSRWG